jgi:hypothetical protein
MVAQRHTADTGDVWSLPVEVSDVGQPQLFHADAIFRHFKRLRRKAPVRYSRGSKYGPLWSVTCYHGIVEVEADNTTVSSEASLGEMRIYDQPRDFRLPICIAADPPKHAMQIGETESLAFGRK